MIPGRGRFAFHIPPESVFTSLRNPYSQFPGTLIHMPRNTQPALDYLQLLISAGENSLNRSECLTIEADSQSVNVHA